MIVRETGLINVDGMMQENKCYKCEKMAVVTINDRNYCSIHGLEETAKIEAELIPKLERAILLGKPKQTRH